MPFDFYAAIKVQGQKCTHAPSGPFGSIGEALAGNMPKEHRIPSVPIYIWANNGAFEFIEYAFIGGNEDVNLLPKSATTLLEGKTILYPAQATLNDETSSLPADISALKNLLYDDIVNGVLDPVVEFVPGFRILQLSGSDVADNDKIFEIAVIDGSDNITWQEADGGAGPNGAFGDVITVSYGPDKNKIFLYGTSGFEAETVEASADVFENDFIVALSDGKTFGKFGNGETVPASGKTARQVLQLAAQEALAPTVTLTSSTSIQFNQTNISNVLNFNFVINSLGGVVSTAVLEWRRTGGSWAELSSNTGITTYTHSLTIGNFETAAFEYRYTVTDDQGAIETATKTIQITSYLSPTITIDAGTATRYLGDIDSVISGVVTRRSPLVDVQSYSIERRVNSGAWTEIDSGAMLAAGDNYSYEDTAADVNSTKVEYRVVITDEHTTTTSSIDVINFYHKAFLGYSSATSLSIAQIEALENGIITNQKERTVNNVTAGAGEYTYIAYAASDGDINNVIMDGAAPVLGALTKLADVSGVNSNGANVTFRIYKSNATQAFTSNSLTIS